MNLPMLPKPKRLKGVFNSFTNVVVELHIFIGPLFLPTITIVVMQHHHHHGNDEEGDDEEVGLLHPFYLLMIPNAWLKF